MFNHVMFSREFAFFPFINFAHRRVRGFRATFERNSFLAFFTITWSEVGKNNVQAKKFYSSEILYLLPHSFHFFFPICEFLVDFSAKVFVRSFCILH